ncbi:hypothetical protein L596_023503 [Steinernema carpocapsae]|uniref:Uncharacterized protein n=1 Tax=Steinernema carpocapsae TaxID=34508 RepID=A0A4U5ME26_STECR|nr:hypothetical protein L596_023503 [Steinernema carpocapsae]
MLQTFLRNQIPLNFIFIASHLVLAVIISQRCSTLHSGSCRVLLLKLLLSPILDSRCEKDTEKKLFWER